MSKLFNLGEEVFTGAVKMGNMVITLSPLLCKVSPESFSSQLSLVFFNTFPCLGIVRGLR